MMYGQMRGAVKGFLLHYCNETFSKISASGWEHMKAVLVTITLVYELVLEFMFLNSNNLSYNAWFHHLES